MTGFESGRDHLQVRGRGDNAPLVRLPQQIQPVDRRDGGERRRVEDEGPSLQRLEVRVDLADPRDVALPNQLGEVPDSHVS